MQRLYPIIRRKRRPLLAEDKPPVVAGNVEPVQAIASKPAEPVVIDAIPKVSDDQASPTVEP